jgi:hypothetical protein
MLNYVEIVEMEWLLLHKRMHKKKREMREEKRKVDHQVIN